MNDMTILDHPNVLRVLFHPRPDYRPVESGQGATVLVEVEPEVSIGGRIYPAAPDAPAILYYHGNGEIAADYTEIAGFYQRIGVTLLVMDYRGYGLSGGTPTSSTLLRDAQAVFDARGQIFADCNLHPARLYVMGRSLGSVPAIEIALHGGNAVSGLIIESGFADTFGLLARLGLPVEGASEAEHGFGNAARIAQITTRSLVLHGTNDVLIPPDDGQALYEQCAASDKRLVLIPGAGHNDILMVGLSEYFDALQAFIFPEEQQG